MKRYLYILTLGVLCSFASCVQEDITVGNGSYYPSSNSGIQIIGASEDFDVKQVGTRANDNGVSDSFISEMTMLIFKANGDMLTAYNANQEELKSSHINIRRSNPTFLIETSKYKGTGILASMEAGMTIKYYDNTATDIDACSIYIVANAYHLIGERLENEEIKTLTQLEAALLDTNIKLDMPYNEQTGEYIGLPMIGCARDVETGNVATFDLAYHEGESNNNAVATIPLKKLYSKVCFSIQVNSKQLVTGQTPEFKLDDVEVFNVPSKVRMGYQSGDYVVNLPDTVATPYLYRYVSDTEKTAFSFAQNNMMPSDVLCRHSSSEDTDDVVKFHFYMPEHKVTPYATEADFKYPDNLPEDNRQYFKPKLIKDNTDDGVTNDKIATFVRIHGSYTDHNGNIHDVAYDIYLGQDNTDDFEVMRNQQLDNKLIITGITNHKDAYDGNDNTISIDHRVSMTNKGYILSMEREAILDAHFEVRPLDIELQPGSTMTIVIPDDDKTWVAMESDESADTSGKYVSDTHLKGVRKYFTTDLVKELNNLDGYTEGNGGTITFENTTTQKKIFRVWFYVDENPNVYDKLLDQGKITSSPNGNGDYEVNDNVKETDKRYRVCPVQFVYNGTKVVKDNATGESETVAVTKTETINFQQWNLWRVWSADKNRYYDIEHEEEYLNNYASDQQYGQTHNGMKWGLENIQLSNKVKTIAISQTSGIVSFLKLIGIDLTSWYTTLINDMPDSPEYDFYLTRDNFPVDLKPSGSSNSDYRRDYCGFTFNTEIATTLLTEYSSDSKAKINDISLIEDPISAFAYCYNKNKRDANGDVCIVNSDGTVNTGNLKWYLPAIDEIEEIALGAYDEFDRVFQKQKYWSCQPAYDKNQLVMPLKAGITWDTLKADYYTDDLDRARATSVFTTDGETYENISSGVPGYAYIQNGTMNWTTPSFGNKETKTLDYKDHPGNLPRTEKCRIRAVYRSGTK